MDYKVFDQYSWRCWYCREPLYLNITTTGMSLQEEPIVEFLFNGITHHMHDRCLKALEVAQRMQGKQ